MKSVNIRIFTVMAVCILAGGSLLVGCSPRISALKSITPMDFYSANALPNGGQANFSGVLNYSQSARSISAPVGTDELWIVSRGSETGRIVDDSPDSGSLLANLGSETIPVPLTHTDVKANVSGSISTVEVTQQFGNPYSEKIEAVYTFPLPHNAAINEFIMTIGKRRIRGIIRERVEAEQIYQEAKRQGYVATLLTEERPNIFTQSVANIEPGQNIDVNIKYFATLDYVDGWYEFVFPMVVGPRFNPAGTTNGVGVVARGENGTSGQKTEVSYLKPGERSGHDISLRVEVDAGVPVEQFECKTHAITKRDLSANRFAVELNPTDAIPNKDFVLRYRVADQHIKSSLLTQRDERGNYFQLMLYPPEEVGALPRQSLELVFVLDCSGSMSGEPIRQAKAAIERGLRLLSPGDSFQIISFSMSASSLGPRPLEATPENVRRGLSYLHSLNAEGGTMMMEGIKAALDFPHDPERLRFICFLTDGYIGNETEILGEIHKRLGDSRIFSFGIGSSVNRYLLDHMAKAGRGAVAYLGPKDNAADIMGAFFDRISHAAITDIKLDWGSMRVSEVFPRELPDLFPGRPIVLMGRFEGSGTTEIRLSGNAGNVQFPIPANLSNTAQTHQGLPAVWARMKIAELSERSTFAPDPELPYVIKQVALDYGLMSPFTSFVAVDSSEVTKGNGNKTVPVAVPAPAGVDYNKTVPNQESAP
jgi:Ca-activated chloride channel family protein